MKYKAKLNEEGIWEAEENSPQDLQEKVLDLGKEKFKRIEVISKDCKSIYHTHKDLKIIENGDELKIFIY